MLPERLNQLRKAFHRHERAIFLVALLTVLALGVWTRLSGFFGDEMGLWLDESSWGKRAIAGDLHYLARPAGFMWATHELVSRYASEQTLRLLPMVAGLLSLPMLFGLLRQVTPNRWAALWGLYLFSVHRVAVAMAKEFKPYSLELLLHLTLLLLAILYLRDGKRLALVAGCLLAPATFWFAWSVAFIFPAFFILLALGSMKRRSLVELALTGVSAAVTLYVVYDIYKQRIADSETKPEFWAKKYDVFTVTENIHSEAIWYLEKAIDLAVFPTYFKYAPDMEWTPRLLPLLAVILCFVGLSALFSRRGRPWAVGLLMPLVVMTVISAKGHWPYGVFRTNVFTLAYTFPLVVLGAAELHRRWLERVHETRRPLVTGVATGVGLLVVLACAPFEPARFSVKEAGDMAYSTSVRAALERIYAWEQANGSVDELLETRATLYLDDHACSLVGFYKSYHSGTKARFEPLFRNRIRTYCQRKISKQLQRASQGKVPFWVITARLGYGRTIQESRWLKACELPINEILPGDNLIARCEPRASRRAPVPAPPAEPSETQEVE